MFPIIKLIADSGSTKTEWCLLQNEKPAIFTSQGMSPYFVDDKGMIKIMEEEVSLHLKNQPIGELHFYGTGCKDPNNKKRLRKVFHKIFPEAKIFIENDLFGAARSL